jgi:hypothetical protein
MRLEIFAKQEMLQINKKLLCIPAYSAEVATKAGCVCSASEGFPVKKARLSKEKKWR